jgi:hypothetical protein
VRNTSRLAIAIVAPIAAGRPEAATNTASRTPAPAGTGTAAKPAVHESVVAIPMRSTGGCGRIARAVNHVAAQMKIHAGT